MNVHQLAVRELRRTGRIVGFGAVTTGSVLALIAHETAVGLPGDPSLRDRWVRAWASTMLRLFSIDVEVFGTIVSPANHGRLVVANHRSAIDAALLLRAFGGAMVSRDDVADWPIIGMATRKVGTLFVDRKNSVSGASTMRAIRTRLQSGGRVNLFPEGTTFEDDTVRPFHAGAFAAALGTRATIVPVGIAYERGSETAFVRQTFVEHMAKVAAAPRSRVTMVVGDGFEIPQGMRAQALALRAHGEVQRLVGEARRHSETRREKRS